MLPLKTYFGALAVLQIAASLALAEEIKPVELVYKCVEPEGFTVRQDRSPVLLIHGIGGSHKNWDKTDRLIAHRVKRKVCAVDLRNHGDSPWDNRTDVEAFTVDIAHFLDKHGIKKVNIIGHNVGGKVGVHYTLKNPERVDSLIVEDFLPNGVPDFVVSRAEYYYKFLKRAVNDTSPKKRTEEEAKQEITYLINLYISTYGRGAFVPGEVIDFYDVKLVNKKWRLKCNYELLEKYWGKPEKMLTESTGKYKGLTLFLAGSGSQVKVFNNEEFIRKYFPEAVIEIATAVYYIHGVRNHAFIEPVQRLLRKVN